MPDDMVTPLIGMHLYADADQPMCSNCGITPTHASFLWVGRACFSSKAPLGTIKASQVVVLNEDM